MTQKKEEEQHDTTPDEPKEIFNKPKKPMCCAFCASLFRDVDDNFKCLEHTDKYGNVLVYGIDNLQIVDKLRDHCSSFEIAKPPIKINTISMEKRLIKKKKSLEPKKEKPQYGQFSLLIDNFQQNVERFFERQPFFYDKQNMFWMWQEKEHKYEMVDDTDLMNMLDDMLGFMGQTVNSKLKAHYIEAFKRVGRKHIPKKAPSKWIQFKDKAFSLESKNIYEVKPNYFFTNPIPFELGITSETPIMDKLIVEWVGEDYKQMAYEIIAYCCLADYPIHLIVCLVGCGRNGKSKFLGMISKFLGEDNICSTELDTLLNSRFESFKLYKKLACIMGETNFNVLSKTSLLKKLTGQDLIGFEYKNKKPFDDVNYAKILIGSNSLPVSEDTSEGFYRRWLIINFENIFAEGHDILKDIPIQEYNNLAKKITEILPELLKKGKFSRQGSIEERTEKYIMASNPLSYFISKHCIKGYGKYMRYSELYTAYRMFLHKHKKRRVSYKEFNDVLAIEGVEVNRTSKKIGEIFVNDRWIEGMDVCDSCDTYDYFLTQKPIGSKELENQSQKTQLSQNELPITDSELVETQEIINYKCSLCGEEQSSFWLPNGKPACLNCYTNYMLQNNNKKI